MNDTQSRKWLITINNPTDHGYSIHGIRNMLDKEKRMYYCMSEEVGKTSGTYHTHIFVYYYGGSRRWSKMKKMFPVGKIETVKGTAQAMREYVYKEGKWAYTDKADTTLEGTLYESGDCPIEAQGKRNDLEVLYDMIKQGKTNYEILEDNPSYITVLDKLDRIRQQILEEKHKRIWRDLEVTYIWGSTGTGKTRGVMEMCDGDYSKVYRVTDYKHPWDAYKGQDIVLFEEFRGQLTMSSMLMYLDGYPLELPCRYNNKQACYTKVYITTNIEFKELYPNVDKRSREALKRRIKYFTRKDKETEWVLVDKKDIPWD